jgi:2-polyprenyl-6-methoxyphenol hydroxylase-like FAD-dependent oxidoreductase
MNRKDVLIGGGGLAGLALAIALRQALGDGIAVMVADPAFARKSQDMRASAIAAAARRLFETLGVWGAVAPDAQPILDMIVTDSKLNDAVRPTFLTFGGEIEPGQPFAHMVENGPLVADRCAPRRRRDGCGPPADCRRRRALKDPRNSRHHDPWLGLRSVRHRHDGRT